MTGRGRARARGRARGRGQPRQEEETVEPGVRDQQPRAPNASYQAADNYGHHQAVAIGGCRPKEPRPTALQPGGGLRGVGRGRSRGDSRQNMHALGRGRGNLGQCADQVPGSHCVDYHEVRHRELTMMDGKMEQLSVRDEEKGKYSHREKKLAPYKVIPAKPQHVKVISAPNQSSVDLLTNHVDVTSDLRSMLIFQYSVNFLPDVELTRTKKKIFNQIKDKFGPDGSFTFMGNMLYSRTRFENSPTSFTVLYENETYVMEFKLVRELPFTCPDVMHMANSQYNNIMHECLGLQSVGNRSQLVDMKNKVTDPRLQVDIIPGYDFSLLEFESGVHLEIDLYSRIFPSGTVYDMLQIRIENGRRNREDIGPIIDNFKREILGSRVINILNNYSYVIQDFGDEETTPRSTFTQKDGTSISFIDYFRNRRQNPYEIKDPRQLMLIMKPNRKDVARGMTGFVHLPMELCKLTAPSASQKKDYRITQCSHINPADRFPRLQQFLRSFHKNTDAKNRMTNFGMDLSNSFLTVQGRKQANEVLVGKNGKEINYDINRDRKETSNWPNNLRRSEVFQTVTDLTPWAVIYPKWKESTVTKFISTLKRISEGRPFCSPLGKPLEYTITRGIPEEFIRQIDDIKLHLPNLKFLLVVLPTDDSQRYSLIKKRCYVDLAVDCQCIKLATISNDRSALSIATNLMYQIQSKLGGEPWAIKLLPKLIKRGNRVMVMGYDAYHDTVSGGCWNQRQSAGAVISTTNDRLTRTFSQVAFHGQHGEIAEQLHEQTLEACHQFYVANQELPASVVFYRDGVGDGQLEEVMEREVKEMREALAKAASKEGSDEAPKLTFIVVKKRINTRFGKFNAEEQKYENPQSGIVVDTKITRPKWFDFYLVSQSVRQGTVTPTHYNIIHEEIGWTVQQYQRFTYMTTHLYYNWPGTIRVPMVCQYAHKLAYIVGNNLHALPNPAMAHKPYYL